MREGKYANTLVGELAGPGGVLTSPCRAGSPRQVDFAHDIVPLIKTHCAKCHTNGKYKGSFSLDTRESILKKKAVIPGKSGRSELVKRITSDDADLRMPPQGAGLTAE